MDYQETLQELNQQMADIQNQLQAAELKRRRYNSLMRDIDKEEKELLALIRQLKKEEADVEKLNSLSLANFYHTVINDKAEQLNKEEEEALEAKLKVDRLEAEIDRQKRDALRLEQTFGQVPALGQQKNDLFEKKKDLLTEHMPGIRHHLEEKEEVIEKDHMLYKELNEAIEAGKSALAQVERIQQSLQSAAGWGTYDMMGGGMIATMAKRGHLDQAQKDMQEFQHYLKAFNRELGDIGSGVSYDIQISEFLGFADMFFDGLFVDWAVQSRIGKAREQMGMLEGRLKQMIFSLRDEAQQCRNRTATNEMAIQKLIEEA